MRLPPDDSAPLLVRVRHVVHDVDPEWLAQSGTMASAYEAVVVELAELVLGDAVMGPERVAKVWSRHFPDESWLLLPRHRYVLNKFARRLKDLAT